MKQHYVPQFFLKNFGYNEKGKFCINVFDIECIKSFTSNVDSVACENNFYRFDQAKKFEKLLSKFESEFSLAINEIIKKRNTKNLSKETKTTLSKFIAIQLNRTPALRINYQQTLEKIYTILLKAHGQKTDAVPEIAAEKAKEYQTDNIMKIANAIYPLILDLKWCLIINKTALPFWTSDNPIFFVNQLPSPSGLSNCGLACVGIEVHFPISSDLSLILLDPIAFPHITEIRIPKLEDNIIYENSLQFFSATRFIYSRSNDFSLAEEIIKSKKNEQV